MRLDVLFLTKKRNDQVIWDNPKWNTIHVTWDGGSVD